jgi:MraZ protein
VVPESNTTPVESPRGIYTARVDEKGRLKLPADMHKFLSGFGEQRVFITSLDEVTARIYPITIWRENEKILAESTDDPEGAEDIAFMANDLGADSDLDAQGRVLVPTELRRQLGLENKPVWLECYQDGINIFNEAVYESRKARARENRAQKLSAFRKKGLR